MAYNNEVLRHKLHRWETYLQDYQLPAWEELPDLGLYMEQVILFLQRSLNYLPPEVKAEQLITASTINNYVRTKVMPEPIKKRYYRLHLAYLVMICTLKQGLSISMIQRLIPRSLTEAEMQQIYTLYVRRHQLSGQYFAAKVKQAAAPILGIDSDSPLCSDRPEDLIAASAVIGGYARLFAEKLLLLEDQALDQVQVDEQPENL